MKIIQSTLGDLCEVDWGNTNLTKSSYVTDGKFLAVSASGPDGRIDHYEHEGYIPVLSAIGAQCGKMFFPTEKFTAIKNTITLTPLKNVVDGKYLYYLFTHIDLPQRGAGQPFISKGDIQSFKISIPKEVKDQQGIVEKLDNAFVEIDSLDKNLQLKEGKTNQLLQSMLSAAFTNSEEFDMNFVKIGDVCNLMTGGTPSRSKSEFFTNGTIKWLVSGDINMREIFDCSGRITSAAMQSSNTKILPLNSVMIALNGQGKTRGTVAMLRTEATCNQSLVSIFPKDLKILKPEFIFYNLNMRYLEIRRLTGDDGNDRRGLNMSLIRDIEIPLPPVEIQNNIVNKIIKISSEIEKLQNQISIEKERISSLRQSILNNAFRFEEKVA
jgi:type I restriction enzyme S subunit